jgi:hypothetical protein
LHGRALLRLEWKTRFDPALRRPRLDISLDFGATFESVESSEELAMTCQNVTSCEFTVQHAWPRLDTVQVESEAYKQLEQIRFVVVNSGHDADFFAVSCESIVVRWQGRLLSTQ